MKVKSKYLGTWVSQREYFCRQNQIQFLLLDVNYVLKILNYHMREVGPLINMVRGENTRS